jgi:hypothetical protein
MQREKLGTLPICPFREGKTKACSKAWGSGWFKLRTSPLRDSAGISPVFTQGFAVFLL